MRPRHRQRLYFRTSILPPRRKHIATIGAKSSASLYRLTTVWARYIKCRLRLFTLCDASSFHLSNPSCLDFLRPVSFEFFSITFQTPTSKDQAHQHKEEYQHHHCGDQPHNQHPPHRYPQKARSLCITRWRSRCAILPVRYFGHGQLRKGFGCLKTEIVTLNGGQRLRRMGIIALLVLPDATLPFCAQDILC